MIRSGKVRSPWLGTMLEIAPICVSGEDSEYERTRLNLSDF